MTRDRLPASLAECRDAEDYFRLLGVDYDERVLAVGRLHILKLFGRELESVSRPPAAEDDGTGELVACRAALERAYQALLTAGPLQHRVFKVLRDHTPGQFVADADVLLEGPTATASVAAIVAAAPAAAAVSAAPRLPVAAAHTEEAS